MRGLNENGMRWLAARLSIAVEDVRRFGGMSVYEMRQALKSIPDSENLTVAYAPSGNLRVTIADKTVEVRPAASNAEIALAFNNPLIATENTKVIALASTPLDRLKGKFLQARGVAQRVANGMEAEADALIAQEDAMKAKTTSAFAPHKAILAEAGNELKAIEDALNLMSNGGPPLDGAENTGAG